MQPGDRELLERAAAGDRTAFGALYSRYKDTIYRFAHAMTGSRDLAADVTQEVFVLFIGDLPRYDPGRAALSTYLYGVARNVTRARLRRERRFRPLEAVAARQYESDPADDLADAEAVRRLRQALRSVPSRLREPIILCDLHGLSYEDAAAVVRASLPALRSRLHRGRRLLREEVIRLQEKKTRLPEAAMRCSV